LLQKLNGRSVNGKVLKTIGARVVEIPMTPSEHLFQLFWLPEVMMILMLIAIYGIIAEMSHPGAIFPGVAGALALILLLYMSATLPVNVAGIALILLAVALFIIDIFAPTHGVLTGGYGHHSGVFHIRRRQGNSRPVPTHPSRQGNDARPYGESAFAD
jgi:membrane-bound serine protease (ClpP class)